MKGANTMNIIACDICKRCIIGNDPSKDATMRPEDLFHSVTFTALIPAYAHDSQKEELTLCTDCKRKMYYYMKNHHALNRDIQSMSLMNRIRYLFKKPMVIKGAGVDGRQDED